MIREMHLKLREKSKEKLMFAFSASPRSIPHRMIGAKIFSWSQMGQAWVRALNRKTPENYLEIIILEAIFRQVSIQFSFHTATALLNCYIISTAPTPIAIGHLPWETLDKLAHRRT
jgi:hypothetical protein